MICGVVDYGLARLDPDRVMAAMEEAKASDDLGGGGGFEKAKAKLQRLIDRNPKRGRG